MMTTEVEATDELITSDPVEKVEQTTTAENEGQNVQSDADKAAKALQRRVDRLTREKYQLRAENEQLRTPKQQADDENKEHLTEDEVENRAQVLAMEIAELKQIKQHCNAVFDKGVKANKDFAKTFQGLVSEIGDPFDSKGKPSNTMAAILDAEEPHKLIQYLADNPDLASELADLPASKQIRRIVQIEKEMGEETKPQKSNAPAPAKPVNAGATTSAKDPATMTDKEFAEWRKADIKRRNGR
jgi:hypothetical protein